MENLQKFGLEVTLQSLAIAFKKYEKLKEIGDLSGCELIEKEFFSKYEQLYSCFLDSENFEKEIINHESIEKILNDILEKNSLSKEFILAQMKKRESLKGHSGAEVVKKLFEFEKKELLSKESKLLRRANDVLRDEFKLNEELSNAIQLSEQVEIIDKLSPLRSEFREIEQKLKDLSDKVKIIEEKLLKKWYYDIYGTIEEKILLNTYGDVFNKGEKGE